MTPYYDYIDKWRPEKETRGRRRKKVMMNGDNKKEIN